MAPDTEDHVNAGKRRIIPSFLWIVALLALRWTYHAFYLPVFEGPDEPFHLGRTIDAIEDGPLGFLASENERLPRIVDEAIKHHPCAEDLAGEFNCPGFAGTEAFNILRRTRQEPTGGWVRNYEAHQPPLSYLIQAILTRLCPGSSDWTVEQLLLFCRILSVLYATAGTWLLFRTVEGRGSRWFLATLLLLPGAAEALIRCSNDSLLFLWTALAISLLVSRHRGAALVATLSLGPLIKLTAFAIIGLALARLWTEGRRRTFGIALMASLVVFPIQGLRGWLWGGTQEVNLAGGPLDEGTISILLGLLRSCYSMGKTAIWLGNWSFFRPPGWLVVLFGVFLLALLVALRPRRDAIAGSVPHMVALLIAVVGTIVFAIGNRKLFGAWGGVGGWYLWGWFPWFAAAFNDSVCMRDKWEGWIRFSAVGLALMANLMWFREAFRLYGVT